MTTEAGERLGVSARQVQHLVARGELRSLARGVVDETSVERARGRARVSWYVAHRSAGERLRTDLIDTKWAAERLGLAATNATDGYLATTDAEAGVSRHGLIRDDTGSVTLRATSMDVAVVRDLVSAGDVLAALDLAESLEVRERRTGIDALDRALEEFRG